MKGTVIEMKMNLQGNSRVDEARNQINDMEHKEAKNNQSEQEEKRILFVSSLWDNFKRSNTCFIGVSEGEGKEQEIVNLFEKTMKEKLS